MIPAIIYGTAWKEEKTEQLTLMALEAGFRGIDTANQRVHYYEEAVGRAIATAIAKGMITRSGLFLQSKFTYQEGQDHRLPYDPKAPYREQVRQSLQSSLDHLHRDYLDSYLLHGPLTPYGFCDEDWQVWREMEQLHAEGKAKHIGISNVNLSQLRELFAGAKVKLSFVQNRCFAVTGWDKEIREFCKKNNIIYQGFSLLTANRQVVQHPIIQDIAQRHRITIAQVIFAFAHQVGMVPLTGTSSQEHMTQDLRSLQMKLSSEEVEAIQKITNDF